MAETIEQVRVRLSPRQRRVYAEWIRAPIWLASRHFVAVPSLLDVLPTMTMPCFVYIGEHDGPELVREYVQQMPNASLLILPGRRHGDTALAVDVFVPSVLEFLAPL